MSGDDNAPWVEKYRPQNMNELVSQGDILNTLNKLLSTNKLPHLLFYGPPGTGKTSTILAVAKKILGPKYKSLVLELNASDNRSISTVRDEIKTYASTKSFMSNALKLVILDEADQMTKDAQAGLRRVIEKYTKTTRFCLICNHINKLSPALQSRCTRFRFGPLKQDDLDGRIRFIADQEGVNLDASGMTAIKALANGDMRKCLNILQSTHMAFGQVNEENVYTCTGNPLPSDVRIILEFMLNKGFKEAFEAVMELSTNKGLALQDITREIHRFVMFMPTLPPNALVDILSGMADVEYRLAAGGSEKVQLASLIAHFQKSRPLIKRAEARKAQAK